MNRYIDREILCNYDLNEEFLSSLSLDIEDIIPLRKVFVLITSEGKKILKLTDSKYERISFIDKSLNFISKKYKDVLSYFKGKDGELTYEFNKNEYIILNMIEGREASFTNEVEIELCTKAIANMHKASIGIFNELSEEDLKGNLGEYLPHKFKEQKEELLNLKRYVSKFKYKCEFDEIFLKNVDRYILNIDNAIGLLAMSEYNSILEDNKKRVLCHNDLAHHNFIVDGVDVKIIDFDYSKIDTRAVDIADYSLRVLKSSFYDIKRFKEIIDKYNSVYELDYREIKLIYAIMSFPRSFVSIVKDYYYKQKKWQYEVFLSRLEDKVKNEDYKQEFLKEVIKEMSEYFY